MYRNQGRKLQSNVKKIKSQDLKGELRQDFKGQEKTLISMMVV